MESILQDINVIENCSDSERERMPLQVAQNSVMCPIFMFEELNRMFEGRIQGIEKEANGNAQLKCIVYKEWTDSLINTQYHMLDGLLEVETAAKQRSNTLGRELEIETQSGHINQFSKMKNDITNLLHLIKRAIEERKWNTEGLQFQTFTIKDIFGGSIEQCKTPAYEMDTQKLNSEFISLNQQVKILESENKDLKDKLELTTKEIQLHGQKGNTVSGSRGIDEPQCSTFGEDKIFQDLICELKQAEHITREQLKELENCLKENEMLRNELNKYKCQIDQKDKVITNIKALTIEVADKHDQIQQMRTQIFALEDELKKAEKKIQFKDNVVKELRRDCKNASKNCFCGKRDLSPISRSVSPDPSCSPKESDFTEFRSAVPQELGKTSQHLSMESDHSKMEKIQCDVKNQSKTLEKEITNLICLQTSCDPSEELQQLLTQQQKIVTDLVHHLMTDLKSASNKLNYVRSRLFSIAYPCEKNLYESDSGYASSEDVEPESTIVETIRARIDSIKEENQNLRSEVEQLHLEIQSATSLSSCGRIVDEGTSANLRGSESPSYECKGTQVDTPSLEETVASLQSELLDKEIVLEKHTKTINTLNREFKCLNEENIELLQRLELKDEKLTQLQEEQLYHKDTISILKDDKEEGEKQLEVALEEIDPKSYSDLLKEKSRLEAECQHQLTTISNLRQALESYKRTAGHSPSRGGGNSFWGWWRNSVHDV